MNKRLFIVVALVNLFYLSLSKGSDLNYFFSNENSKCQILSNADSLLKVQSILRYEKTLLNNDETEQKQKSIRKLMINCAEYIYEKKEFKPYIKDYSEYLEKKLFSQANKFFDKSELFVQNQNIDKLLTTYDAYLKNTKISNNQLEDLKKIFKSKQLEKNICKTSSVDTTNMGPNQNQDDVAWCYAFSSADIYSFYAKQRVSALDIAVLFNQYYPEKIKQKSDAYFFNQDIKDETIKKLNLDPKKVKEDVLLNNTDASLEFGESVYALLFAVQNGVCNEKDFPNKSHDYVRLSQKLSAPAYYKLKSFNGDYECKDRLGRTSLIFPKLNIEEIEEVIKKSNIDNVLYSLRNKACKNLVKSPIKNIAYKLNEFEALKAINSSLDKNEPSIIDYKIKMLLPSEAGAHSSTVIGRRFNSISGQCEYQIRNSWGNKVDRAPFSKIEHDKNGNYWVDEKTLVSNILRSVTVSSK